MDTTAVTSLLDAGFKTDEATTAASFRSTANAVHCTKANDQPLPTNVTRMPHLVFDADLRHLSER